MSRANASQRGHLALVPLFSRVFVDLNDILRFVYGR